MTKQKINTRSKLKIPRKITKLNGTRSAVARKSDTFLMYANFHVPRVRPEERALGTGLEDCVVLSAAIV